MLSVPEGLKCCRGFEVASVVNGLRWNETWAMTEDLVWSCTWFDCFYCDTDQWPWPICCTDDLWSVYSQTCVECVCAACGQTSMMCFCFECEYLACNCYQYWSCLVFVTIKHCQHWVKHVQKDENRQKNNKIMK